MQYNKDIETYWAEFAMKFEKNENQYDIRLSLTQKHRNRQTILILLLPC